MQKKFAKIFAFVLIFGLTSTVMAQQLSTVEVTVDYSKSVSSYTQADKFDKEPEWVTSPFAEVNFPSVRKGKALLKMQSFTCRDLGWKTEVGRPEMSTGEVVAAMSEKSCRPASIREFLAYLRSQSRARQGKWLVALESFTDHGFPSFQGLDTRRKVQINRFTGVFAESGWGCRWQFVAVCE